jgi:hypothetical protein
MIHSGPRPAPEKRGITARLARNAIEIGEKIEFGDLHSVNPATSLTLHTHADYAIPAHDSCLVTVILSSTCALMS